MNRKINCYKLNLCLSCPKIGGNYNIDHFNKPLQYINIKKSLSDIMNLFE